MSNASILFRTPPSGLTIFYTDNIIKYTHKKALSIIQRAFFGDKK